MIIKIKWINSNLNPTDAIMKVNAYNVLRNLVDINTINLNIKKWVERG